MTRVDLHLESLCEALEDEVRLLNRDQIVNICATGIIRESRRISLVRQLSPGLPLIIYSDRRV